MNKPLEFLAIEFETSKLSPNVTIVRFRGNLDASNLRKLVDAFERILEEKRYFLVAEMSGLNFISSPALGVLMGVKRRVVEQNGNLLLVGVPPDLKTKLTLMGADRIFSFYHNIRSAIHRITWEYQKKSEVIQMEIPPKLEYVPVLRRFISQVAQQKGYSRKDGFRMETIIDEICNNAIEHGDNTSSRIPVKVMVSIDHDKVNFQVTNKTRPEQFQQLQKCMADIGASPALPMGMRGRGLNLVSKLAQGLDVEITDEGTRIHVTKLREE